MTVTISLPCYDVYVPLDNKRLLNEVIEQVIAWALPEVERIKGRKFEVETWCFSHGTLIIHARGL